MTVKKASVIVAAFFVCTILFSYNIVHANYYNAAPAFRFYKRHLLEQVEGLTRDNFTSDSDYQFKRNNYPIARMVYNNQLSSNFSLYIGIERLETILWSAINLPQDSDGNQNLYEQFNRLHDLIHEVSERMLTLKYWQVGLTSFTAGITLVLIIAIVWGRSS